MKRLVSILVLLLPVLTAQGQIGNEWIQYSQPYFKIPVSENGLFRISYTALQQAGFPLSADPRKLQLFHRGSEQAIHIAGESDGVINASDYIEFYGRRNDGTLDSTLYAVPSNQPHKYYNLYSDTTAYFLTIGSVNGKRMPVVSLSPEGLAPETYHWDERLLVLKEHYSAGIDYGSIQHTTFDVGEGWMGSQILQGQEVTYTVDAITDTSPGSGKPMLELALTGRGPMLHSVEIYAGTRMLSVISFQGYETYKYTAELEWTDVDATGKILFRIRVPGTGGPDRVSANYIRVLFPRAITMSGAGQQVFRLEPNATDVSYLRIQNPASGMRVFDITDPASVKVLLGDWNSSFDVVVPSTTVSRKLFATNAFLAASGIRRITFRPINSSAHDYVIVTHPSLRKPSSGYIDPVKAFAEYRSLPEGGNFDTLVVNIDQLYDQFNYGEASPRAIYQFLKFFAVGKLPQYLFLIGKGLDVNYGYRRNTAVFTNYKDLVPTAGYPASDAAFTAGLGGTMGAHAVATGRLTANRPADVAAYLNKIKERDALPYTDLNRKKILHLSGGIEESEPVYFRDILRGYQAVAEDQYLGGKVQAIVKRATDIKLINIAEEVNQGLGLITFFGHSAPNTLDFDIGLVSDPVMGYDNAGKYPFLLMNGCDAGSFFLNTSIIGENWIMTPGKGAIGYIAHSSYGLVSALQRYSSLFYDVAFADSAFIRKGVGMVQTEVARRYLQLYGSAPLAMSQIQQMVLLGDPAVKVFGAEKPDYSIDAENIKILSLTEEPVTALTDSFRILIGLRNTGISRDQDIRLNIKREFNGGQLVEYDTIIPSVLYADTLSFIIRNRDRSVYGINRFVIHVDADNLVSELDESNNTAIYEYFLPLNSTRNLYPYNFSIINARDVGLSFQYTDMLATPRDFLLEVDTVKTFDSDFKQQFTVTKSLLGRQDVLLLEKDSIVYYWRTKIAQPLENESKTWTVSSFAYIKDGPEGWAQMHFPQFEDDQAIGLVKDPQLRRIQFQETVSDVAIRTFATAAGKPQDSISFRINRVEFNLLHEGGACRNNTINLVAFDRRSTQPYAGLYFKWYEPGRRLLCGREPYVINNFTPLELSTGNGDDLDQYIDNIATGDSVVLFNIGNAGFEQWPEAAKTKLGLIGVSTAQLDDLRNGDAVVIFGRKGSAPGTAKLFHETTAEALVIDKTIAGRFTSGTLSSGAIGPAQKWERFDSKVTEAESVDNFHFTVVGLKIDGTRDTLKTDLAVEDDLSFIDALVYPRIEVLFTPEDNVNLTAVQLPKWFVFYEPVAEGLAFHRGILEPLTVSEGQEFSQEFGFINISNNTFPDSVTVRYELVSETRPTRTPSVIKISAPAPLDTTFFSLSFNTLSKGGVNDIEVFVNPGETPEVTFDNNLLQFEDYVNVLTDGADPVMSVTFDGRHIEDDEYVSASPVIEIRLWDDNAFLFKQDTLGVKLFLAYPCDADECMFRPVYFSGSDVTWAPATETSDYLVRFLPANLQSGRYMLRVEAADRSGNISTEPYEIHFQVDIAERILVTAPYPNPFFMESTIDIFVTGEETQSNSYTFSISAIDGRIISDYVSEKPLHVGKNSLSWNGKSADGRELPNGLYFYRLRIDGKSGNEYTGKFVILR